MADEKVIFTMTGVTKYFEKKPVFRDISLSYYYGAKIGVLGLNGSGKSTLVRLLSTLLLPDGGGARVFGYDVVVNRPKVAAYRAPGAPITSFGVLAWVRRPVFTKMRCPPATKALMVGLLDRKSVV